MILDEQLMFSDDQDLSQVAGTYVSTNVIDLGADRDIGKGIPVPILIQVTETFTSGGAATLQILVQTDDNAAMGSPETLYDTGAIALASLVAGYRPALMNFVPRTNQRYMRISYIIGTATTTAGTVTSGITAGNQDSWS